MRSFLADFHVHTSFSDGLVDMTEIVDLYGQRGFGAIAITDHIAEDATLIGYVAQQLGKVLTRETFPRYLERLAEERERAWDRYGMVVLAGFELSKNSISNRRSAHLLGIGIDRYVSADADAPELIDAIHAQGGIAIAAHPVNTRQWEKQTYHLWERRRELSSRFDAWEVASGSVLFAEVAAEKLPKIASSDLHVARQLSSWKTLLDCERHPGAILEAIRRQELAFVYYDDPLAAPGPDARAAS